MISSVCVFVNRTLKKILFQFTFFLMHMSEALSNVLYDLSHGVSRYKAIMHDEEMLEHCTLPKNLICVIVHIRFEYQDPFPYSMKGLFWDYGSQVAALQTCNFLNEASLSANGIMSHIYFPSPLSSAYTNRSVYNVGSDAFKKSFRERRCLWVPTDACLEQGKRWKGTHGVREAWIAAVVRTASVFS